MKQGETHGLRDRDLRVKERRYCDDDSLPSFGLANLHAVVPGVEENKEKILRALQVFREHGANIAIFPEFSLSGYFWEDEPACWKYMHEAVTEEHTDWIDNELKPLLVYPLVGVVLNNITRGPDGRFFNTTMTVSADPTRDYLAPEATYNKVFLPGIEKTYTQSGRDDRLVLESRHGFGRFGFSTCYDYLFGSLMREYALVDEVDVMLQVASWRGLAERDYPGMNVSTDHYYGELWNLTMAANAASHQVWTIACNAVGRHGVSDVAFWGGSGIWTPSGLPLIQASNINEELLIVHNLNLEETRAAELDDFNYAFDFSLVYRPTKSARSFTRNVE